MIDFKEAILKTKGSVEHTGFAFSGEYLYQYRMKKITFGSQILHQMMTEFVSQKWKNLATKEKIMCAKWKTYFLIVDQG